MSAIDEIHIGEAGRTEENRVARRLARGSVGGRVVVAEVSFGFDNAPRQNCGRGIANQQFSEQGTRDLAGIAIEEVGVQPRDAA